MTTSSTRKLGLQFTERMTGYFLRDPNIDFDTLGTTDPKAADPFEFTVTVRTDDLDEMLASPQHEASMTGTITAPALSPQPMTITQGLFNLFVENPAEVQTRNMRYGLQFGDAAGKQFYLDGNKIIRNEPLLHVWDDTSTLFITLHDGADAGAPVIGRGILQIVPADFLKQMTTVRILNAENRKQELAAIARFGSFFAGILWESYGGVFAGPTAFDPSAPPREKRPLRVSALEVHAFT